MQVEITNPNILLLLLFTGILLIYTEFSKPGLFVPGALGAASTMVALTCLSKLPITWNGSLLLLASMVCYALEARFVTRGFLTIVGAILMVLGCICLIDSTYPGLQVSLLVAIGITLPFAAVSSFLFSVASRARRVKFSAGQGGMIGMVGVASNELNPAGLVRIRGQYWNAHSQQRIAAGQHVEVSGYDGLTVLVKAVKQETE